MLLEVIVPFFLSVSVSSCQEVTYFIMSIEASEDTTVGQKYGFIRTSRQYELVISCKQRYIHTRVFLCQAKTWNFEKLTTILGHNGARL